MGHAGPSSAVADNGPCKRSAGRCGRASGHDRRTGCTGCRAARTLCRPFPAMTGNPAPRPGRPAARWPAGRQPRPLGACRRAARAKRRLRLLRRGRAFGGRRHECRRPQLARHAAAPERSGSRAATETPWHGRDNRPCSARWATNGGQTKRRVSSVVSASTDSAQSARAGKQPPQLRPKIPPRILRDKFFYAVWRGSAAGSRAFPGKLMWDRPCPQCREAWGQGMCPKNRRPFPEFGRIE